MYNIIKSAIVVISFFCLLLFAYQIIAKGVEEQKSDEKEDWISLFNGKDLDGWQVKFKGYPLGHNYKNTVQVEDGLLRVKYDEWDNFDGIFGHIFYKEEFSHYRLRVEYRFVGDQVMGGPGWAFRNNGLMLHGQAAETMELDQNFPVSVEVQLLGGNGRDERSTMNLCTPGTHVEMNGVLIKRHCTSSRSKTYHGDQWVSVEVEVRGGEIIRHFVDGEEVMSYEKPQLDSEDQYFQKLLPEDGNLILHKGTISIQAESHPTDFRKIELLILNID